MRCFGLAARVALGLGIAGCGGSTFEEAPSAGGSSGSGASSGSGGSSGSGASSGAGGTGGLATGGNGGATRCNPPEPRSCDAGAFSFAYDPATGTCQLLGPSQCNDGYAFETLAACEAECGAKPELELCDVSSDCRLMLIGCCTSCEPVAASTLTAINTRRSQDYARPCDPAECGACPAADELSTTGQYFVPACSNHRCVVLDIRTHAVTECRTDADCRLRDGSACCAGCDGRGLLAYSSDALFTAQCGPSSGVPTIACPECDAMTSAYMATCREGRCAVAPASLPPPL